MLLQANWCTSHFILGLKFDNNQEICYKINILILLPIWYILQNNVLWNYLIFENHYFFLTKKKKSFIVRFLALKTLNIIKRFLGWKFKKLHHKKKRNLNLLSFGGTRMEFWLISCQSMEKTFLNIAYRIQWPLKNLVRNFLKVNGRSV